MDSNSLVCIQILQAQFLAILQNSQTQIAQMNSSHLSNIDAITLQTDTIIPNTRLDSTAYLEINREINEFIGLSDSFLANASFNSPH